MREESGWLPLHLPPLPHGTCACVDCCDALVVSQFRIVDVHRFSMLKMGLAPCAPFTVTNDLMISAATLARKHKGVR